MKEKSMAELWQIVLDNFDEYFFFGICNTVDNLNESGFITTKEQYLLLTEIGELQNKNNMYFFEFVWPVDEKQPRIDWIKERIKHHSK